MVRPFAVAWVLVFASLGAGLTGCVKSDLGTECVLVRKGDVDGGDAVAFLTNADVSKGRVYISYGATECEDLVCVRDENFPEDTANPGLPAKGYCSKLCVPQDGPTLNNNCPAANPARQSRGLPEPALLPRAHAGSRDPRRLPGGRSRGRREALPAGHDALLLRPRHGAHRLRNVALSRTSPR